jgi:Ca2+-binding RTX toxin-like protein
LIENAYGTEYNDTIIGNAEANSLLGYGGDDLLSGNYGNDNIQGGEGDEGDDKLYGGLGQDTLFGGLGSDTFVFDSILDASTNKDTITDFAINQDEILLNNRIFNSLVEEGTLSVVNFSSSTTGVAVDENDYILYNTTSGALKWYRKSGHKVKSS